MAKRAIKHTQCPECGKYAAGHGQQHGYIEIMNNLGQSRLIIDDPEDELPPIH